MSKSKGEFLTVSLLEEKGYDPMVYRLFCLLSHYRKPLEFTWEGLDNVAKTYDKLIKKIQSLGKEGDVDQAVYTEYEKKFAESLGNDMNTSSGITVVYDVLKADTNGATKRAILGRIDEVLSLSLLREPEEDANEVDQELAGYIEQMIEERKAAKKEKNFARADEIRDELLAKGIVLKDTREGTTWERA